LSSLFKLTIISSLNTANCHEQTHRLQPFLPSAGAWPTATDHPYCLAVPSPLHLPTTVATVADADMGGLVIMTISEYWQQRGYSKEEADEIQRLQIIAARESMEKEEYEDQYFNLG
jgi:hypothetical protein